MKIRLWKICMTMPDGARKAVFVQNKRLLASLARKKLYMSSFAMTIDFKWKPKTRTMAVMYSTESELESLQSFLSRDDPELHSGYEVSFSDAFSNYEDALK